MRRNRPEDVIGDIVLTGFLVAGTIAVMAGIAIANWLKTPTEEKLRRLTPQEDWGEFIP